MGTNWVIVFIVGSVVGAVIMSLRFTLTQPVLRFGLTQPDSNKAKDDPFTGTWREKDKLAEMSKLIIKPGNDGLSFQRSRYQKPLVISYGKEFVDEYPFLERMEGMPVSMATVVRIDDHTLAVQGRVVGKVDFPHSSLADLLHNPVVRNGLANLGHQNLREKAYNILLPYILVKSELIICG